MLVSVVLSTRNRADRLAATLESFSAIHLSNVDWEVVVADNGSNDQTPAVLEAWCDRLPLSSVRTTQHGLSRGRNAAIAAASGELLVFTDDDVTVSTGWLEAYLRAWRVHGSGFYFGGPIESVLEIPLPTSPWAALAPSSVRGLDWGVEERSLTPGEYFIGPNWACPADPVRKAGGFDPRMGLGACDGPPGGEENELMDRLAAAGLRSWYIPAARLKHWVPREKIGETHLRARHEALAAVRAWRGQTSYNTLRINRVPVRLWIDYAAALLRHTGGRMGLGDRVAAEIQLAWCRGLWSGFRLPPRERTAASEWIRFDQRDGAPAAMKVPRSSESD